MTTEVDVGDEMKLTTQRSPLRPAKTPKPNETSQPKSDLHLWQSGKRVRIWFRVLAESNLFATELTTCKQITRDKRSTIDHIVKVNSVQDIVKDACSLAEDSQEGEEAL
jgi:hypothetical protein